MLGIDQPLGGEEFFFLDCLRTIHRSPIAARQTEYVTVLGAVTTSLQPPVDRTQLCDKLGRC